LTRQATTNWIEGSAFVPVVAEQLADAAPAQHRLGDQRGLGTVVARLDQALQAIRLHGFSIGQEIRFMSSG
jgi:hypothetical protein